MRRFVRPPRLVHFSASSRPKRRKPPLTESSASATRLPPPSTVEGRPLCHRENCPAHGTLTQKDALWLFSLRPWAAAICRRLGLRGQDVEDATQSAFTSALSSWALFHHNEELPLLEQRRCWFAAIVWRCASKLRYRRDRQKHVERRGASELPQSFPSHECRVAARAILRKLPYSTTPERWRVWAAYRVHGVPVEDIAIIEGRPLGTIYNLLRLARTDFVSALRREAAAASGPVVNRRTSKVR